MVSKNTVLISVNRETKKDLDKIKIHPNLSYNDVIVGLIQDRNKLQIPPIVDISTGN